MQSHSYFTLLFWATSIHFQSDNRWEADAGPKQPHQVIATLLFYRIILRDNCIQHLRKGHTDHSQTSTTASWEETELCWHLLDVSPRLIHLVALALAQSPSPSWQSRLLRGECRQGPASPGFTLLCMLHPLSRAITPSVSECSFKGSPAM